MLGLTFIFFPFPSFSFHSLYVQRTLIFKNLRGHKLLKLIPSPIISKGTTFTLNLTFAKNKQLGGEGVNIGVNEGKHLPFRCEKKPHPRQYGSDPTSWTSHLSSQKLALSPLQSNVFHSLFKNTAQAQERNVGAGGGGVGGKSEEDRTSSFCKKARREGKGPSESLRGGVVREPGRRQGSCGRETRDQGAGFPLGTPPDLQAPPPPKAGPPTRSPPARGAPRTPPAGRGLLSPQRRFAPSCPPRPPAPHAAPGSGKRGGRRAGPGTGRSPRGRFPPPPLTPGTRPGPRGRHRVTQPGRRRGRGGRGLGAAASPRCEGHSGRGWGPRAAGSVAPGAPRRPPSAPQRAGVCDRNRLPTWRTGSGPARRREHSSRAGSGGSGHGAPAAGAAAGADGGIRCPKGASRGGNYPRGEGSQPPPNPRRGTARPQVGSRRRGMEGTSSALPSPLRRPPAIASRTPPQSGLARPSRVTPRRASGG